MAALLGVNFGSQKHAYFQTRITIHELTNVPMVAGQFKAKWKVEHTHNLASAIASATAAASSSSSANPSTSTTAPESKQFHHLAHKKSTSTLSSSFDRDESGSIDSGSIRRAHHKGGDDASSTYSNNTKSDRKGSYRIFSGIRDALRPHSSSQTSPASSKKSKTPRDSQDTRRSMDVKSNDGDDGSEEASEVLTDYHHGRESSQQSNSSNGNQHHSHHHNHGIGNNHPRGETSSSPVKDSRVVWEKQLDVGVRFNVEKPRNVSGGSHSGTTLNEQAAIKSSRSTDAPMRRSASQRDVLANSAGILHHDGSGSNTSHDTSGWGMLASSELRISVRADVPTGIEGNHADHQTMMKFGHVSINLAEFAPHPHHHHHHHHHYHTTHSEHHHHHVLSRTETRRYLLLEGPTNATVKITVEMKHVGGTREYQVPANRRGLLVGSLVPTLEGSSPTGSKGPSSSAGSEADDGSSSNGGSADQPSSETHGGGRSTSVTKALSDWSPHSVARHSRIPEENLRTKLSHKDTARAVKERGGGGRLAFSFAAGAHHDRPPESVIDSLFDSNMLTPTPSRDEKSSLHQQQKKGQDKSEQTPKARDMASKQFSNAGQSARSHNSSASSKSGGVRWDLSTEKAKSSSSSIPESGPDEQNTKSTKASSDSEPNSGPSTSNPLSSSRRKEEHDTKTSGEDKYRTSVQLQPPQTPPDVVRNEELSKAHPALVYPTPWSETSTATETPPTTPSLNKKQSRRTLGLTKESAMMAGYRGAGWGTLELSKHGSNLSIDSSDSGSEQGNHSLHNHHRSPTFAYLHDRTRSPSPSPLQQLAH
ncbi:uncharacterized protein FA14DRAFT_161347 [Meira miltonrushii]|uniref:C2 NT-type domain-containing protein n=1 Tax=Meira miltonrushii TaxID=1280837 RepID=A0A316V7R7_9BASI|nr:uncharacterized protein FA14DRAFT_161347 [Meira miltonrushii]PWN33550.1 hypothetical protein FA14DRAFT_161347 [Meira miltonrushii]